MSGASLIAFAGGVGLFLLGMKLMTDGLKVAAGEALRRVLSKWTSSLGRAVASGILVTAVVQSSSAVIFAVIGFVNAGLLTLVQALGVIYGANVGTTITTWLVALVGFKFDIKALALPAVAAGMLMQVVFSGRRAALGSALAGLGVFFLGIDVLKSAFESLGDGIPLESITQMGWLGQVLLVLVGIGLTVAMQSSSAALVVTVTAAAGGLIPLSAAAAVAVGANIGTTSTGLLAVIGATSAAKRAALAHLIYNVAGGTAALLALPWLLGFAQAIANGTGLGAAPATVLAVFHTLVNLLGLAIMLPITGTLAARLERMFVSAEEDAGRPRHLDNNVLGAPALALEATALELQRAVQLARAMGISALDRGRDAGALSAMRSAVGRLVLAVAGFAASVQRDALSDEESEKVQQALRAAQYLGDAADHWGDAVRAQEHGADTPDLAAARLRLMHLFGDHKDDDGWSVRIPEIVYLYESTKSRIIESAAQGQVSVPAMMHALDELAAARAGAQQIAKAEACIARIKRHAS